jgi:Ca-activated chloride channel family protein
VIGGSSFNDAPTVAAGTWTDTLQTGEMLYYRTRVDWGQQLAVTFRMLPDSQVQQLLGYNGPPLSLYAYAPDRAPVTMLSSAETRKLLRPAETTTLFQSLPQVRYRNREQVAHDGPVAPVSLGGYYYYAIQLGTWGKQAQVPVQISVQLAGEPSGKPAYAAPQGRATDSDGDGNTSKVEQSDGQRTPQPNETTPAAAEKPLAARIVPVALVAGSGVLVLAGVVLAVLLLRGSRRPQPTPPPNQPRSNGSHGW